MTEFETILFNLLTQEQKQADLTPAEAFNLNYVIESLMKKEN